MTKSNAQRIAALQNEIDSLRAEAVAKGHSAEVAERVEKVSADLAAARNMLDEAVEDHGYTVTYFEGQKKVFESATVDMQKWLITVLVVLSSAALLALISKTQHTGPFQAAALLFLIGIMTALSAGSYLEQVGKQGLRFTDMISRLDFRELKTKDRRLEEAKELSRRFDRSMSRVSFYRFASLLAFVAGVIILIFFK